MKNSLVGGATALFLGPWAFSQTVLIGPNPSVRNGGFEDASIGAGSSLEVIPFWESYFNPEGQSGANTGVLSGTNARSGVRRIGANGFQQTDPASIYPRLHPAQIIPAGEWTIAEGDVLTFTVHVRAGFNFDVGVDSVQLIVHVVNPVSNAPVPTQLGNADRLLSELIPAGAITATGYTAFTATSAPVPSGSPWIGQLVQARVLVNGTRDEFALVDDVSLVGYRASELTGAASLVASFQAEGSTDNGESGGGPGVADGGLAYGPGFGSGQAFDPTSGGVTLPFSPQGAFSASLWMKASASGPEEGNLRWDDGSAILDGSVGSGEGFGLSLRGSLVALGFGNGLLLSQTAVADGRWHHVAFSRNALGEAKLYLDGRLEDVEVLSAPLAPTPDLKLGASRLGGRAFAGLVDEVRLFNGILQPADLAAIQISSGDLDGDGFSDEAEVVAGTDWGDRNDFLQVAELSKEGSEVRVQVDGRQARQYQLERYPELSSEESGTVADALPALEFDTEIELVDTTAPSDRAFYRVRAEEGTPPKPNILFIVADDQGFADMSAYPNARPDISTPHLDRIAAAGTLFTQAYVTSPVCSPSRAGYLTGRYQNEWDPTGGWAPRLPLNVKHIAEYLKEAGYDTRMIGKNDFGQPTGSINNRDHPTNHGFDSFFGFNAHAHDFWLSSQSITDSVIPPWPTEASAHLGQYINSELPGSFETTPDDEWQTALFTDRAIEYLEGREGDPDPFFLYLSHASVHALIHQVPESYLVEEGVPVLELYNPATNTRTNPASYNTYYYRYSRPTPQEPNGIIADADMRKYYRAHLKAYDDQTGRLLDALASEGLAENTVIVYISDNGGEALTGANNSPLSGSKYNVFEGGIRTPMLLSWPGRIPEGQTYEHVTSVLDIVPTLLAVAGVKDAAPLSGHSLLEPVRKNIPVVPGDRTLFWRFTDQWAIRRGDWKLVLGRKSLADKATSQIVFNNAALDKVSLFNLAADPGEMNDLSASTDPAIQAIRADLQTRFDAWNSSH